MPPTDPDFHFSRIINPYKTSSRVLKKSRSWFDLLTTNGKMSMFSKLTPFALSLSKGTEPIFQHPAR